MNVKVLMFGWEFPPHNSGGLGTACYGLSRSLSRAGAAITFVLPKQMHGYDDKHVKIVFANTKGKKIRVRFENVLLRPYVSELEYDEYIKRLPDDVNYGLSLYDEVRRYGVRGKAVAEEEDFDVIHAHDWLSFRAGIEAKKVSGKPLIVHVHATEFDRTGGSPNKLIYDEERLGMHAADCIIAVSHLTKNTIIEHYGIEPDKVMVVHNGVDINEFHKELPVALGEVKLAGKKIVLFVGRITIQKGPDYFIQAAQRVLRYEPNAVFVVSGSGDMEHRMIRLAADLGIGDKVIFAGFVRGDQLAQLYRAADLYVMPSVSEPFGITALEALANGTPILISKTSGAAEVVEHALKVDFWDVDEMADKIVGVLQSAPLREVMSHFGKSEVRGISWENAAGKCIGVYQTMLEKL